MEVVNFAMLTNTSPAVRLGQLLHHRWALPIIVEIHQSDGAKFVTLVNHLKVSKDSLSRTLQALIALDLVIRNPGHGHPLRPEYVLTPGGMVLGDPALRLMRLLQDLKIEQVALRKWSLPVLLALLGGVERFSGVLEIFPALTTRALSLTLKDLEGAGLIEHTDATYVPTARGQLLIQPLASLAEILELQM